MIAEPQNMPGVSKQQPRAVTETDQAYKVWDISLFLDGPEGQTLTTGLCQTWADFLQQDTTFLAVRFPLVGQNQPGTPYAILPVVFHGDQPASFSLFVWGGQDVLVAPLEYRTQYFAFLENMLPTAPDTHWVALGVGTPTQACSEGLTADRWSGVFSFQLDFGGAPDACLGCNLDHYFCYEGDAAPPFFNTASFRLGANAIRPAYRDEGITCFGPLSLLLQNEEAPALALMESHMGRAAAGDQVVYTHFLSNHSSTALDVTLTYSSTLGLPWSFYEMLSWDQPDLSKPITGTVTLPAQGELWFTAVVDLPAEAEGMENLSLDATSVQAPTLTSHTSDVVWIGGWLTPPPPASTPTPTASPTPTSTPQTLHLYMPVVLRS